MLLAGTALVTLVSGSAMAADLSRPTAAPAPVYTKAPMMAPFSWTGLYVGLNAGGHWSKDDDSGANIAANTFWIPANVAIMSAALPVTLKDSGFAGGGQLGYNWQASSFVFGVEADIMGLMGTGNRALVVPWLIPTQQATLTDSASDRWMATFRARAGVAIDHVLIYATGGGAAANWSITHTYSDNFGAGTPLTTDQASTTRFGWTAGGGIEWALTNNWSVRGEFLYADFGTVASSLTFVNGRGSATLAHADHLTESVARAGINYRFGGGY
jgi:outer membrane immunogenic protein